MMGILDRIITAIGFGDSKKKDPPVNKSVRDQPSAPITPDVASSLSEGFNLKPTTPAQSQLVPFRDDIRNSPPQKVVKNNAKQQPPFAGNSENTKIKSSNKAAKRAANKIGTKTANNQQLRSSVSPPEYTNYTPPSDVPSSNLESKKRKRNKKAKQQNKKNQHRVDSEDSQDKVEKSRSNFCIPVEAFSIDDYYKSYNFQNEGDYYYDDTNEEEGYEFIGQTIFDVNEQSFDRPQKKSMKTLPPLYEELLIAARANNKVLSEKLISKPEFYDRILQKLKRRFSTPEEAAEKFEIYNYLQLIHEYLETDEPLAKGATIIFDNSDSQKARKATGKDRKAILAAKNIEKHQAKQTLTIQIPFEKGAFVDEKIVPLHGIFLIPDDDVRDAVDCPAIFEVNPLEVIPGNQNGFHYVIVTFKGQLKEKLEALNGVSLSIFLRPIIEPYNHIMAAIHTLVNNPALILKVFPPVLHDKKQNPQVERYHSQMNKKLNSMFHNSPKSFNQKQKEAIYAITRPVNSTFILFGPPGTGKTYTLVEAVRQLMDPKASKVPIPAERRILICTPSNTAADAFAETLIDRKFIDNNDIFRLVSTRRDAYQRNPKLDCITHTSVLVSSDLEVIRPVYELPNCEILVNFKIIICTLGSTPTVRNKVNPGHFSHIIIDEAAQAAEYEAWLAIGQLAADDTRVILAGDHKQLGPVTTLQALNNPKYGFKTSLLARLVSQHGQKNSPQFLVQLTDNYRSHRSIVKISSSLFYNDTLVPTYPKGHDSLCRLPFLLQNDDFPILFHSVTTGSEEISDKKSRRNIAEADAVFYYVNECLKHGVKDADIGVVSPYKYQAELIRERLKNPEIVVETVERFQGSERRVIIISTIITSFNMGFMGDDLRLNTAITRAKQLLVVVGNKNVLGKHQSWKKFIQYCADNRALVDTFPTSAIV